MTVAPGTIDIWQIDLQHFDQAVVRDVRETLSKDEVERAERFHHEEDRNRFILRRGALRRLLGGYLRKDPQAIQFQYGPFGKPFLEGHPIHFNLSHSHHRVLMACSTEQPLGVDVEYSEKELDYLSVARHFFAPGEVAQLEQAGHDVLPRWFFNCWTRKEAFIKARGDGLTYPLNRFEVPVTDHADRGIQLHDEPIEGEEQWMLELLRTEEDYRSALVYQGKRSEISYQDSSELL